MRDAHAGHRDYDDPFWTPADSSVWTYWDFALTEAYRMRENFRDGDSGQPRWLAEDPDVHWSVGETVSFASADLQKEQERVKDKPGHNVYLKDPTKDGEFWTLDEWLDAIQNDTRVMERGAPAGARPPTPEELKMLMERKKAKAEG